MDRGCADLDLVVPEEIDVSSLFVFGSAVSGSFDPDRSDIDFLVDFVHPSSVSRFDAFFGLEDGHEDLFGRPVDLVSASALNNPSMPGRRLVPGMAPRPGDPMSVADLP